MPGIDGRLPTPLFSALNRRRIASTFFVIEWVLCRYRHKTHWTGHKSRLDRDLKNRFGSRSYAAEELIAELGAAFLCAEFGFDGDLRHAGYLATWIDLVRADKRAFFTACSQASKAADYLRGLALAEPADVAA
ncbi:MULTISPECIES: zincin-like metallopeptidase domain-containing protein [unclassified Bradyrhizobium]|uniref:zincin-like metallopeptidase domain-containing protein n=1 Tax=unclassified Bradyrhizobium TaxID=2631580 RepID=UPI001FF70BE5|nr:MULTISPECIES: zincin-like metallopeptidase domain-containing protein [unclassified Bradyrhizobium]MCK1712241.1 antirestriction protein [Bradyrhizobium sp. 143]MCK1730237.1 antirestriction protein [Bradyrhizobium sp. 142]